MVDKLVFVMLCNNDDRLAQVEWSLFVADAHKSITDNATKVHLVCYSPSESPLQNACIGFSIADGGPAIALLTELERMCYEHHQDTITWAEAGVVRTIIPPQEPDGEGLV